MVSPKRLNDFQNGSIAAFEGLDNFVCQLWVWWTTKLPKAINILYNCCDKDEGCFIYCITLTPRPMWAGDQSPN